MHCPGRFSDTAESRSGIVLPDTLAIKRAGGIACEQMGEAGVRDETEVVGHSFDFVWASAYDDLKQLARQRLRSTGAGALLDTVGLVNDVWLRMAAQRHLPVDGRRQFFAYCGRVMHSVVVDLIREHAAQRRGGAWECVTLNTGIAESLPEADPLWVHEALEALARLEPRLAQVVEMRYFGGFTEAEIADALSLTERTVRRDWDKARLLLQSMLDD